MPETNTSSDHKPRLLELVREKMRLNHYSIRTEKAYVDWIKRFILFHGKHHPEGMSTAVIEAFYLGSGARNVQACKLKGICTD